MRKVKEKRPDVGGRCLICTPPISSELQLFSGGLAAVGRGASATGATVEDGWLTLELAPFVADSPLGLGLIPFSSPSASLVTRVSGGGLLGFVMGIADFVTVREAMALARAR
jgi:hypothetical protein